MDEEKVRAKFSVYSILQYNGGVTVTLTPVYSPEEGSENKKFWKATPSGKIEMNILTDAAAIFHLGQEFYIDFIPVS